MLQYESVLNDCNQALSLEFHNVKALFRRAQAYKVQLLSVLLLLETAVWFVTVFLGRRFDRVDLI